MTPGGNAVVVQRLLAQQRSRSRRTRCSASWPRIERDTRG